MYLRPWLPLFVLTGKLTARWRCSTHCRMKLHEFRRSQRVRWRTRTSEHAGRSARRDTLTYLSRRIDLLLMLPIGQLDKAALAARLQFSDDALAHDSNS